ncbi:hypothetical protein M2272_005171 [Mycobacterium frederiksbergense]|uniref:PE-PGRS family protein n=1 Tax=Mycolicibacterium frederiksbergense TaxID=117567 RepID=A0ABT6L8F6_9MYCO|nr:hypothetical protein [Mycolicibacterium frederiksbergense]MDH6198512.1 hypothetical protein [Mycolicibacterium frederiksbergense]
MSLALRPYVTAGVALVGASVIAVTPVAAPPPAIQTHAVQLSAAVEDPVSQWVGIVNRTFNESGAIVQTVLNNPAPILQQIITNQIGYIETAAKTLQTVADSYRTMFDPSFPFSIPNTLINAVNLVLSGDAAAASQIIWGNIFQGALFRAFPLMALTQIPTKMAQNFANVVATVGTISMSLGMSAFQILRAPFQAFEDTANDFSEALANQDTAGAALALASFPGRVVDMTVNGLPFGGVRYGGLVGVGGLIPNLVAVPETIAKAIAPKPPETPETPEAVSADRTAGSADATRAIESLPTTNTDDSAAPEVTNTASAPIRPATTERAQLTVRDSAIVAPGKTGTTTAPNRAAAKAVSDAGDHVSATVNKIGEGLKKALTKPAKPAQADTAKSDAGDSGSAKHRAGSGSSGDSK